jgi:integrase
MRVRLSVQKIAELGTVPGWHRDTESPLLLRVEAGRPPAFVFEYAAPDGRRRRETLGSIAAMSLDDARKAVRVRAGSLAATGADPLSEKARRRTAAASTVQHAVDDLIAAKRRAGQRWVGESERVFARNILPALGRLPLSSVTRKDVQRLLSGIAEKTPRSANIAHALLRRLFRWSVATGRLDANPISELPPPARNVSRDRVLSDDELRTIWQATGALGWPFGPATRLLILTAARRDEIGEAPWSEFNLDGALWTLPPARSKNGTEHRAPLAPQTVALLRDLPRIDGSAFLFPGRNRRDERGDRPVSGWGMPKQRLDAEIARLRAKDNLPPLASWTFHDFRRSAASWMVDAGISPTVIDKVLSHRAGISTSDVGRIYMRADMLPQRAAALAAWAAHVESLTAEAAPVANVVQLRA